MRQEKIEKIENKITIKQNYYSKTKRVLNHYLEI
jgi:hypothetical protein